MHIHHLAFTEELKQNSLSGVVKHILNRVYAIMQHVSCKCRMSTDIAGRRAIVMGMARSLNDRTRRRGALNWTATTSLSVSHVVL